MYTPRKLELYDLSGNRKYLNEGERKQFYNSACKCDQPIKLFCLMFFWTGARISEVLNIKVTHIDFYNKLVVIETLKRRKRGVFRQVPLPDCYLVELRAFISMGNTKERVWSWSRSTGSRYIKVVMNDAQIIGIQASSKGMRHGFAIHCVTNNIPLILVQKWLGHKSIATTMIYLDIVGIEERNLAQRIWPAENYQTRFNFLFKILCETLRTLMKLTKVKTLFFL